MGISSSTTARGAIGVVTIGIATACGLSVVGNAEDAPDPSDGSAASLIDGSSTSADSGAQQANDGAPTNDSGDAGPQPDPLIELGCNASAASKLLAYWRLDEGSGITVHDCTSGAHDGTLLGPSAWASPGRVGASAVSLGGAGSATFGVVPAFNLTDALSISAWVNVTSFATAGRVLSKSGTVGDRGWELSVETDGSAGFKIAVAADTRVEVYAAGIPLGQWVHLAGVYEPNVAVRLYVNGAEAVFSTTNIPAAQRDTVYVVTLGDRPVGSTPWSGLLDDVRLFGRPLSAAEVTLLAK